MWSIEERARLREELLAAARGDRRIVAAALTGSASVGLEDRWSDVDLAFGVGDASELQDALAGWTALMYERHRALQHVDVPVGSMVYRVFLLWSAPSATTCWRWRRCATACRRRTGGGWTGCRPR